MREDIEFKSDGSTCRGWFYHDGSGDPRPTIVLAGGWCYVREVVMPTYAETFLDAGMNALVFDYRNLGVSDGENRQHLDPWEQIRDYESALHYLEGHESVDAQRIGAWGISYSGGHVLVLAAIDPRVRAVVSQLPVVDGYQNMLRAHGTMSYRRLWERILEDRRARYRDPDERLYIPHASPNPEDEISTWPFPETYETFMEIKESQAPLYENRSTVESVDLLMRYDIRPFVRRIYDVPTMVIVAEGDDLTLWDLEIEAFNSLPTPTKQLEILPGATHMTVYSDESKLRGAATRARDWFTNHLRP